MKSYFLQDSYGQIAPVYSISAGLTILAALNTHISLIGVQNMYLQLTSSCCGFPLSFKIEGIIPAIESSHAVAHAGSYYG